MSEPVTTPPPARAPKVSAGARITVPEREAAERDHRQRTRRWTEPARDRRERGIAHPVLDFLFTYYHHRPARLARWDPGYGFVVEDAEAWLVDRSHYIQVSGGVTLDPQVVLRKREVIERTHRLLAATAARPAALGCFGMHEWAMVYRAPADQIRHSTHTLRLGSAGTDAVVERLPLRCTHFDAFRFFTAEAEPLNDNRPTRQGMVDLEQPGCLHANMDCYRLAYTLWPLVSSDLVADCFDLAVRIREVDMRASPYDLAAIGYPPIRIETPAGRAEYVRRQREFAAEAGLLRDRLLAVSNGLSDLLRDDQPGSAADSAPDLCSP
jgi:hypothetical protein